jgi:pimeloyl-ACP methyl ester carboxylesterase
MITYKIIEIQGIPIFFRESGPKDAPALLLLHGFPSSSHMFRNLIPLLSDRFRVVAPDYPGFGNSGQPAIDQFPVNRRGILTRHRRPRLTQPEIK